MKLLIKIGLIFAAGAILLILAGCKSAEVRAYQTLAVTQESVEAALKAWGDYCKQVQVPAQTHTNVQKALKAYQDASDVLEDAVLAYKAGQRKDLTDATRHVVQSANDFIRVVNEARSDAK